MISLVQQNAVAATFLPPSSDFIDLPVGENVQDNPSMYMVEMLEMGKTDIFCQVST